MKVFSILPLAVERRYIRKMQVSQAAAKAVFISGIMLCPPAVAAAQPVSGPIQADSQAMSSQAAGGLSPDSPLAPMPDIGIPWPDIDGDQPVIEGDVTVESAPLDASTQEFSLDEDQMQRHYSVRIEGLDGLPRDEIEAQFNSLSALKTHGAKDAGANAAQIDRRAREDVELLEDMLRAKGYYEARVDRLVTVAPHDNKRLLVTLTVDPGRIFTYESVDITGVASDRYELVRPLLKLEVGDPIDAIKTQSAELGLKLGLPRTGFAFSSIGQADIVVDHSQNAGRFSIPVDTGPMAYFGEIRLSGDDIFSAKHVSQIARFDPGERYDADDIDDLRRAIVATGLVGDVDITPVKGATRADGSVIANLDIHMDAAPMRTVAGTAGYDTGQGVRAEVSWQHRNLLRPEGAVTFRGVAGTREQLIGAELRRSNFKRRDQILTGRVNAQRQRLDAYDAETLLIGAGIERQTNLIWQKKWIWSIGAELIGSREKDIDLTTGNAIRRTFFIAALPGRIAYDGSDDLLDPHRGFRLSARISPEVSLQSGRTSYVRAQLDGSAYQPFASDNYVLAGRFRFGQILGAKNQSIAPSRRFYSGGGGSVRGYGYQRIGPRDMYNDPIGGRSLTELAIEARIRFGDFGVVPFFDAGQLYTSTLPKFSDLRYGAGIGMRYYTSFGPVRIDVATPLNRNKGDSRVAVYVSLGQAF